MIWCQTMYGPFFIRYGKDIIPCHTDQCDRRFNRHLTHWGQVTHICVGKRTIIGSDNGLSPGRHQAVIWTNAGILLIGPSETHFNEILIEILAFSLKKMRLVVSSAKWRPFCPRLNVLHNRHIWQWLMMISLCLLNTFAFVAVMLHDYAVLSQKAKTCVLER